MKKIRTLIVDDEPLARKAIRLLLAKDPDITVAGECKNGAEAAVSIVELQPDLVFLDIQMPHMNGFEVIDAVHPDHMPGVVFVTAYDAYALKAFDAQAIDYVLKPFDDARFQQSLRRAKKMIRGGDLKSFTEQLSQLSRSRPRSSGILSRVLLKKGRKAVLVDVSDIMLIEAADYCVVIHTAKERFVHRQPLKELEAILNPSSFFRSHRSAIVNIDHIREIQPTRGGDYRILLENGTFAKLSRSRKRALATLIS